MASVRFEQFSGQLLDYYGWCFLFLSLLYIQKKKKEKRLYLEERKIPITNMTEETETAPERERKQMMVVR